MKTNNLLLYGAIAVGAVYLYNRYTKKPTPKEEEQGGGGGGGGGFGPVGPLPVIPSSQGKVVDAILFKKETTPTPASTSSTSAGAIFNKGVTNTGGIVPVSQGGSVTPQYSTGSVTQSQMSTGLSGGSVFKPFDGDNGRMRLENIVRSFNRP